MASIELRGNAFRIVFRYQRQKFNRSLKTDDPDTANACLARVADNLRRLDMGLIAVPEGADNPHPARAQIAPDYEPFPVCVNRTRTE